MTLRIEKWACAKREFADLKIDNNLHNWGCFFIGTCLKEEKERFVEFSFDRSPKV